MSIILCSGKGVPSWIDTDDLPRLEENKALTRITEIAAVLEQNGFEGVRVQTIDTHDGRFICSIDIEKNTLGARLIEHFSYYASEHKEIPTVNAALEFACNVRKELGSNLQETSI